MTDPALREELVDLANTAHQRGWMLDIRKSLPQDFHAFHKWESSLVGEAAEETNITIQVLPKSVGASPALEGPFSILTLPDPVPDLGYAEGPLRAVYVEDREEVRSYTLRFGRLTAESLSAAESVKVITDAAQHFQEA
ncbi:Scr1 family TA system antitoxin-like transcriptional regulator [Actinokineospora cianjurensis]|uniref:Scr1 family TA system antitoxin-like transcriptional regulator n=1 Tax=Actinokineospora cianjurensis TaxID=585224 RepID=UPI000EB4B3C6|nr:Scr1 family TA system antitoxin-like transcriptional regulator [Actinokineospora cianjurensis]